MMYIITTPEPRPVFIDLVFHWSNGLTREEVYEEIFDLHRAARERIEDRTAFEEWGELGPFALVNLHENREFRVQTIIQWPDEEALSSLAALLDDRWPAFHWNVAYEVVGPGHKAWRSHAAAFWDHGCQYNHDETWRTD